MQEVQHRFLRFYVLHKYTTYLLYNLHKSYCLTFFVQFAQIQIPVFVYSAIAIFFNFLEFCKIMGFEIVSVVYTICTKNRRVLNIFKRRSVSYLHAARVKRLVRNVLKTSYGAGVFRDKAQVIL